MHQKRCLTRMDKIFIIFCLSTSTTVLLIVIFSAWEIGEGDCEVVMKSNLKYIKQIKSLETKILLLEKELEKQKDRMNFTISDISSQNKDKNIPFVKDSQRLFEKKIEAAKKDISHLLDEFDVIQYASFTQKFIYVVNSGTYGRVLERLEGVKKKDIQEVIMFATSQIYSKRQNLTQRYIFTDGLYRTLPGIGMQYEIYFSSVSSPGIRQKVSLLRPSGPLQFMSTISADAKLDPIHMIMPLAERTDMLLRFMTNFVQTVVRGNENVELTIAYSGEEAYEEAEKIVADTKAKNDFPGIRLIRVPGRFSRGRAIQTAVDAIKDEDALMFFVDVDVMYRSSFLQRCRLNTEPGRKVFYPIIFSLYNPEAVYTLQDVRMPPERDMYIVSSETGFWRDFGYGMTCQYKKDFSRLGGFRRDIEGWGMEDVYLFRKYAQSNISIVRSVDHGLFHTWHAKTCQQNLPWEKFKACIGSKARTEASHSLLGMLAFSEEVASYKKRHGMMHHTLKPKK